MDQGMNQDQMQQGEGGGGDTGQVFMDIANGLAVVTDAVMQSNAPDDLKGRMQGVMQEYMAIVDELTGGGAQGGGGGQPMPVEQSPGAVPYSQAGV